jgi:hypothetical protein
MRIARNAGHENRQRDVLLHCSSRTLSPASVAELQHTSKHRPKAVPLPSTSASSLTNFLARTCFNVDAALRCAAYNAAAVGSRHHQSISQLTARKLQHKCVLWLPRTCLTLMPRCAAYSAAATGSTVVMAKRFSRVPKRGPARRWRRHVSYLMQHISNKTAGRY